jgi:biopolymer transport protein ExbD
MLKFLIYLFESSFCLSILYLVYILFFRKETYFNFNRAYLLGAMLFALLIPVIHINIKVDDLNDIESRVQEIGKFRTSYEQIISWLDPDFESSGYQYVNYADFEGNDLETNYSEAIGGKGNVHHSLGNNSYIENKKNKSIWNPLNMILWIYFIGIVLFSGRLFLLFFWLFRTIKNNHIIEKNELKVVQLNEDVPPFSFLRYVFVNQSAVSTNDLQQILAHEKVHIRQNHSFDLLLAHGISVLLWFNPFAWLLQKAIKTTHEYIADRKVVDQGFELIDYQSLLLSQLISIRSVELVNNFNLISIKKRIVMMTKNKSGLASKFKAFLIIPFSLALFFVFADMTIKGPGRLLANYYDWEILDKDFQLDGIWKSKHADSQEEYLLFEGNKLYVLEKGNMLREYEYQFKDNKLFVKFGRGEAIPLKFKKAGNEIAIWWNQNAFTTFVKTSFSNTLESKLNSLPYSLSLPEMTQTRIIEREELCFEVYLSKDKILIGNKEVGSSMLQSQIRQQKNAFRALDLPFVTVKLFVDENTPMQKIDDLQKVLRNEGLFKIAYVGKTDESRVPLLLAHAAAIPQKLPPVDAKILDENELKNTEFNLISWDLSNSKSSVADLEKELTKFIIDSKKYLMVLNYDDKTTYGRYIAHINAIYKTIFNLRNQRATKLYQLNFEELSGIQQDRIKKEYPITLTQRNLSDK